MKKIAIYACIICAMHIFFNYNQISELQFNSLHFSTIASFYLATSNLKYKIPLSILVYIPSVYVYYENTYTDGLTNHFTTAISILTIFLLGVLNYRTEKSLSIPILILFTICYMLFLGNYFIYPLNFSGIDIDRYFYRMLLSGDGIFGDIATISSTYIFIFSLYSALLIKSGSLKFIDTIATHFGNKFKGGCAQVSILSSCFLGMTSGSTVSNVVSAGSITIPMMKKEGWNNNTAGAIEATASLGSQLMPPVMGAGAFIMSQLTNIAYSKIIMYALIPAILYYVFLSINIFVLSNKNNIKINTDIEKLNFIQSIPFFMSLFTSLGLIVIGYTAIFSVCVSMIVVIILKMILDRSYDVSYLVDVCKYSITNTFSITFLLIFVGIFVGSMTISGVCVSIGILLNSMNSILLIPCIVLFSILLGLGLPASATYLLLALTCATPLTLLILPNELLMLYNSGVFTPQVINYIFCTHMFLFWLSQDSNISPPVAVASYSAAVIAGGDPSKTSYIAWKLSKGLYFIPLLFLTTQILFGSVLQILYVSILTIICFLFLISAIEGHFFKKITIINRITNVVIACVLYYCCTLSVF